MLRNTNGIEISFSFLKVEKGTESQWLMFQEFDSVLREADAYKLRVVGLAILFQPGNTCLKGTLLSRKMLNFKYQFITTGKKKVVQEGKTC